MSFHSLIQIIILFLICNISFSQTKDSSGSSLSGSFSLTGLLQSGNTNKFLLQGKGELKRVNKILETILLAAGSYGESKGNKDDNSYYGSLSAGPVSTELADRRGLQTSHSCPYSV